MAPPNGFGNKLFFNRLVIQLFFRVFRFFPANEVQQIFSFCNFLGNTLLYMENQRFYGVFIIAFHFQRQFGIASFILTPQFVS